MNPSRRLVLDAGNTRVKIGLFEGQQLLELQAIPVEDFAGTALPAADVAAFATVSVAETELLDALHAAGIGRIASFGKGEPLPFPSVYTSPATLGQDRKAAILAALTRFPGKACLLLVLGSCITYDLVSADGRHLGGDISPGYRMRLRAMHTFTGRLPLPDATKAAPPLGTDTETALLSGAYNGMAAEISARIAAFEALEPDLTIILSGGDAPFFEKTFRKQIFAEPNLALYGLNALLEATFFHGK